MDADIGQVAVHLGVVQTVAHHELIRHLEAREVRLHGLHPAGGLVQQRHDGDAGGPLGEEVVLQKGQGVAGVQDVLHDDEIPAGDVLLDIVGDLHPAGGAGGVAVGADGDELQVALQGAGADQIGHKDEAALQDPQEEGLLPLEPLRELRAHLRHPAGDVLLGKQYLQDVILHFVVHSLSSPLFLILSQI